MQAGGRIVAVFIVTASSVIDVAFFFGNKCWAAIVVRISDTAAVVSPVWEGWVV